MRIEKSTSKTGPLQGGPKPKEALKAGPKPQAAPVGIAQDANRAKTGPLSVPPSADIGGLELPTAKLKPMAASQPYKRPDGADPAEEEHIRGMRPRKSVGSSDGELGGGG